MKYLLALAFVGGLSLVGSTSAAPINAPQFATPVQYCGPDCQRHRYWEQQRRRERHHWQQRNQDWRYGRPYYGYQPNHGYRPYNPYGRH